VARRCLTALFRSDARRNHATDPMLPINALWLRL
jgi:hypothetical protein